MSDTLDLDVAFMDLTTAGVSGLIWPVPRSELSFLSDSLLRAYLAVHRGHPEDAAYPTALLAHFFVGEAVTVFEAMALAERSAGRGVTVAAAHLRLHGALAAGIAPSTDPFVQDLLGVPRSSSWRASARYARWRLRSEPFSVRRLRSVDLRGDIVALHTGGLLAEHARRIGAAPRLVLYEELVGALEAPAVPAASRPVVEEILSVVADAYRALGSGLPGHVGAYLRSWLELGAAAVAAHVERLLADPARLPRHLWIGTAGSTWGRLIAYAVSRSGGTVTAHDHGTGSGYRSNHPKSVVDFVACDRFVTFNDTQAIAYRELLDADLLLLRDDPPEISALPAGAGGSGGAAPVRPPAGRRVIVATAFYRGDRKMLSPRLADPVSLDWQARLLSDLVARGYDVAHKHHPSGPRPPRRLYDVTGASALDGPFEDHLGHADLVLIADDSATTVFRSALENGLPLVLANLSLQGFTPEARRLLERRCAVIDGDTGADGRAVVDLDAVAEGLETAADRTDPAFYDRFMRIQ